jgi:hypothetical protein
MFDWCSYNNTDHPSESKAIYGDSREGRGKQLINIFSDDIGCVYGDGCDCRTCNNSVWRLAKQKPLYAQSVDAHFSVSPEDFIRDFMAGDQTMIGMYKQVSNLHQLFMQRPPTPVWTQYYDKFDGEKMALGRVVHACPTPNTIRDLPLQSFFDPIDGCTMERRSKKTLGSI